MSVKLGLLALLAEEQRHGYELKVEFERRTGGVWPLNVGQVYTTLDRLERDGMVIAESVNGARNQRKYAISDAGLEELRAWRSSAPDDPGPPRDELTIKVLLAATSDRRTALAVIATQRKALFAALQARRRDRKDAAGGDDLAAELTNDALAVRVEADLRWLDHCEARLQDASAKAPPIRGR